MRAGGEKDVDDIRTLVEEVDMRIAETKRATYEFKRDIIMGGEDLHTGVTSADKMVRCVGGRECLGVDGRGRWAVCVCCALAASCTCTWQSIVW